MKRKASNIHPFFVEFSKRKKSKKKRKLPFGSKNCDFSLGLPFHVNNVQFNFSPPNLKKEEHIDVNEEQIVSVKKDEPEITKKNSKSHVSSVGNSSISNFLKKLIKSKPKIFLLFYGNVGSGKSHYFSSFFSSYEKFEVNILNFDSSFNFNKKNIYNQNCIVLVENLEDSYLKNFLNQVSRRDLNFIFVFINNSRSNYLKKNAKFDYKIKFSNFILFKNKLPIKDLSGILLKKNLLTKIFKKYWVYFPQQNIDCLKVICCIFKNDIRKIIGNIAFYLQIRRKINVKYFFKLRNSYENNRLYHRFLNTDTGDKFENSFYFSEFDSIFGSKSKSMNYYKSIHGNKVYWCKENDNFKSGVLNYSIKWETVFDNPLFWIQKNKIKSKTKKYLKKVTNLKNYLNRKADVDFLDFVEKINRYCENNKNEKKRGRKKRYFHYLQMKLDLKELEFFNVVISKIK